MRRRRRGEWATEPRGPSQWPLAMTQRLVVVRLDVVCDLPRPAQLRSESRLGVTPRSDSRIMRVRFWIRRSDRARLQASAGDPPGRAARPAARRSVFGAALEQWDALHAASAAVAPAASPVLLFYALSQAGRALNAACIDGQPWRPTGHGLHVDTPNDEKAPLGETLLVPDDKRDSSFRLLCKTIGSPTLTAATRLGALWAANPHAEHALGLGAEDCAERPVEPDRW